MNGMWVIQSWNFSIIWRRMQERMSEVSKRIEELKRRIEKAAQRAGRDPQDIKIVAAIKGVSFDLVREALKAGINDLGENRIQEAEPRFDIIKKEFPEVRWHMIGHLQTNKVKKALKMFDLIQSLESLHLAREISKRATHPEEVLIEVNTSKEEAKYGILLENAVELVQQISTLPNLLVKGLMTVAVFSENIEKVRFCFKTLKNLQEKIKKENIPNVEMKYLSMGMTDDFEIAIEEGSNIIRIGRLIFGSRT